MWLWATYFKLAGHSLDTSCLTVSCQDLERFQYPQILLFRKERRAVQAL